MMSRKLCVGFISAWFCAYTTGVSADDDASFFDEITVDKVEPVALSDRKSEMSGYIQQKIAYGINSPKSEYTFYRKEPGFTRIETSLRLDMGYEFSDAIQGQLNLRTWYNDYYRQEDPPVRYWEESDTESGVEIKEAFLDLQLSDAWWLKLGRQTVAWGESDTLTIVDIVNPRDLSIFGEFDLEDMRLPVSALKASYNAQTWLLELVSMVEYRRNRYANEYSDFDPLIGVRNSGITVAEAKNSEFIVDDPEYALRFYKIFNGLDLGIYLADYFEDAPRYELHSNGEQWVLSPSRDRVKMAGLSGALVRGSWLFKGEMAYLEDVSAEILGAGVYPDSRLLKGMLGFEIGFLENYFLSFETYGENQLKGPKDAVDETSSFGWVSRFTCDLLNDRLHGELFLNKLTQNDGIVYRATAEYDIKDALVFSLSFVDYQVQDDEAFLDPYTESDTIISSIRYSF